VSVEESVATSSLPPLPARAPLATGLAAGALMLLAFFALDALVGFRPHAAKSLPISAILVVYGVVAAGYVYRGFVRMLDELRDVCVDIDPEEATRIFTGPASRRAALLGGGLGVLLAILDPGEGYGIRTTHFWRNDLVFWLPANALLYGVIGAGVGVMIRLTRFLVRLGERIPRIDLLQVESLEPFARFGLRTSLFWIVGTSIASILFLEGELMIPVILLMAGIVVMAVLVLLLPLRGVRRRVRRAKAEERARVDEAIRREREALLGGGGSTRLGELLAWRSFIVSVREWPLDAGALARLALYLAIGLASWVGAAMVEHALFG
jgi:hypothetical protein